MANWFEALSLPVRLSVGKEDVDEAWRSLSQESHPDIADGSSGNESALLNEAREGLSNPASKLSHWLELKNSSSVARNTALSSDLMDIFASVGDALSEADKVISAIKQSQTALAKSLLAPRAIKAQQKVQTRLGEITSRINAIEGRFSDFEQEGETNHFDEAIAALGELKFLDKWQKECQQRLLELIAI